MKILFFSRRFWPSIGGVEKHVLQLSMELIQKGNKVTVVTESHDASSKCKVQSAKLPGINIYRIPITRGERLKKFQIWKWLWKNRYLIQEADIVHCHDVFFWYLPFRFLYPKKKVFTTFHGYEGSEPPTWKKILSHKLAGWLSNGSIVIGDFHRKWYGVKSEAVSYGAAEKGSLDSATHQHQKVHSFARNDKCHFCFVGRLAKDTGIMIYLEALKILKKKGISYRLVVCGEGPRMDEAIEFSKKHGLNVEFEGFVRDVEKYLKQSKFVFVSRYLGILEAMINKKLVFAVYDSPIKEDYLKMSPFSKWIVIESDPKELAKKVKFYFENPLEEKKLIEEAYNWAREQTWEKLTKNYLELWVIPEV